MCQQAMYAATAHSELIDCMSVIVRVEASIIEFRECRPGKGSKKICHDRRKLVTV